MICAAACATNALNGIAKIAATTPRHERSSVAIADTSPAVEIQPMIVQYHRELIFCFMVSSLSLCVLVTL
jgi:hypothetical protein